MAGAGESPAPAGAVRARLRRPIVQSYGDECCLVAAEFGVLDDWQAWRTANSSGFQTRI
jgi:predicted subunit of tRNA(5-methylaminomethyl-2-thiouridylate) methyltransferase